VLLMQFPISIHFSSTSPELVFPNSLSAGKKRFLSVTLNSKL